MDATSDEIVALADWRRRVSELYRDIRHDPDPTHAWERWCAVRGELVATHPQSPIPAAAREAFRGLHHRPYDPAFRTTAEVVGVEPTAVEIGTSTGAMARFHRFGRAVFELAGEERSLALFWLDAYGGGLYLSFRDATSGSSSYGGGRYLLDTAKGADLGTESGRLILDFNFAYQPSCSYDPRWSCPLPPPENRLELAVEAGERVGS